MNKELCKRCFNERRVVKWGGYEDHLWGRFLDCPAYEGTKNWDMKDNAIPPGCYYYLEQLVMEQSHE